MADVPDWTQRHEPNPILLDLRKFRAAKPHVTWTSILKRFDYAVEHAGYYVSNDWERYERGEFTEHARRVLTRLARLEVAS
jgi:hypothetical protein